MQDCHCLEWTYGDVMMSKQKVGNIFYVIPVVMIGIYLLIALTAKELPTKKVTFLFLSAAIIVSAFSSLLTEDIGIRGYGTVKKSERPGLYWFQVVFLGLLGVSFLILAFFVTT